MISSAVSAIWICVVIACAIGGGYVSFTKGRDIPEGACLGAVFGPLGMLVAALLPTIPEA